MPKKKKTVNLTDRYIRELTPKKRTEIYDSVESGLVLRVTPKGSKSFSYRYRYRGKTRRYTIGKYGKQEHDKSLADARAKVRELRVRLQDGEDPQGDRQRKRPGGADAFTFSELVEEYRAIHLKPTLRESTQYEYNLILDKKLLPALGDTEADEVTRDQVVKLLDGIAGEGHKRTAGITRGVLSSVLSFGVDERLIKQNIVAGIKAKRYRSETRAAGGRDRFYSEDELKQLWEGFDKAGFVAGNLLRVLLLLGQRAGETSRMKWQDIEGDIWTVPGEDAKNGEPHVVPLTSEAMQVIEGMREHAGSSPYVFQSPSVNHPDKPIRTELTRPKEKVREESGIEDFKPHDLRRTVATYMAKLGTDRTTLGKLLNHKQLAGGSAITSVYDRYSRLPEVREAMQAWHDHLADILRREIS